QKKKEPERGEWGKQGQIVREMLRERGQIRFRRLKIGKDDHRGRGPVENEDWKPIDEIANGGLPALLSLVGPRRQSVGRNAACLFEVGLLLGLGIQVVELEVSQYEIE